LRSHQMSMQRERVCQDLIQFQTRGRSYPEITFGYLGANCLTNLLYYAG
jgi:hypothetical protein